MQTVQRVLQTSGLEAGFLELELTEGIVMQDLEATSGKLFALREMGVSVSIDDCFQPLCLFFISTKMQGAFLSKQSNFCDKSGF